MTKLREIIEASWGKDCRQILARVSLENIQEVLWLVNLPPTVESGLEINAHLPISADDRVGVWYTPTD